MMVERYPNLKEEVDSSIPGCEISSLLVKKLVRRSTASYASALAYRDYVLKEKEKDVINPYYIDKSNVKEPTHIVSLFPFVQSDVGYVLDGNFWEILQEFVDFVVGGCFNVQQRCGVHKVTFSHVEFVPKVLNHNLQLTLKCIPTSCNDLYLVFNNDWGILKVTFSHTFSPPKLV